MDSATIGKSMTLPWSFMVFQIFKQQSCNRDRNLSVGSLCLGSVCIGLTLGWPESSLSYIIVTNCVGACSDISWGAAASVRMLMNFGSCLGALIPTCIADSCGRRSSFAFAGILNALFWSILVFPQGHMEIILNAAFGGFATGVFVTTSALYVSEITLPQTRAVTAALAAFCAYCGILVGSCFMFITFIHIIAMIIVFISIIFIVTLQCWMIESPYFLFSKGKTLEAKLSLKALRGARNVLEIDSEYRTIELFFHFKHYKSPYRTQSRLFSIVENRSRKRIWALLVIIALYVTQMVGSYGMNDYSRHFLDGAMPIYGHIVISTLDVISIGVCIYVIEKCAKRPLLLALSILGTSISRLVLAVLTLVNRRIEMNQGKEESSILAPTVILSLYYTIYLFGLTPILPILTAEAFPSRFKTITVAFGISLLYFLSMVTQFTFEVLTSMKGYDLAFAVFGIFGALGIPFILIIIPNRQGQILDSIQRELEEFTVVLT